MTGGDAERNQKTIRHFSGSSLKNSLKNPAQAALGVKPLCSDEQFKDYITQIVSRYKGKITYYELGNEPDLRPTWRDNPDE